MRNAEIAKAFKDIADLLELKGENPFKIRAYRKAAHIIEHLPKELKTMLEEGENIQKIPGIGEAIAKKIQELIYTGKLNAYEELKSQFPVGILQLMEIPGIGPRTAYRLITELNIESVDQLEKAILEGRVSHLFRMGEKSAKNILQHIHSLRRKDRRIPIGEALPLVEDVIKKLKEVPGVTQLLPAGSLRRFRETVGDIDIMGTARDPREVIEIFCSMPDVKEVVAKGSTKASIIVHPDVQMDLRIVEPDAFGSLLQYFTGSKEHNIELRTKAQKKGLKLSEYGITEIKQNKIEKFSSEEAFYDRLGMQYIPPEIREGRGEIEVAESGALPKLVSLSDIKGDLHVHTHWSDGINSIEEMAEAAIACGYEYMAVTDHSRGRGGMRGLDESRLRKQMEEINRLNRFFQPFRILTGIEVDIRADGTLDLPDSILAELDIVIAAIHSSFRQSSEQMTKRMLMALRNPHVDIIGHPTCRLIGERNPVELDLDAIFRETKKMGKALEINAMPDRLDLKDLHVFQAREAGVMLALGTDAHNIHQLHLMRFGLGVARRGWCEKSHILNCLPLEELLAFLRH
ncbi:MAG: DNA polymerase/3'-5' exonuclease PolX [Syntrophales bacterium]|nr:DNA polymerase/3'-5' exonuclease PolX [Syntrophales bacterium]